MTERSENWLLRASAFTISCAMAVPQGLETTVEESSGSIDKELREAVAKSNNSFRGAAEGRRAVVSPADALGAASTVRGESWSV